MYDLFGRYGGIRQIRLGNDAKTKGTAFVVFDDVMDAKNALEHLNGFHLQDRYIVGEFARFIEKKMWTLTVTSTFLSFQ
jgi:RNA recognition motif-containing protein